MATPKILAYFIERGFFIAFVHLPGQRVSDRKAIEKSSSTKKFREHQMEILYLGGVKQTVYFDTGRLQGYPLCEIDFFHFLIGFSIRNWSIEMWEGLPKKLVTPKKWLPQKNWLPQKIDQKRIGYPKKFGVLYCEGGLLVIFGKMAYFILYWFINAI